MQKQNLIKLQKLQREKKRYAETTKTSLTSKDIGRLKDQFIKLKKYNDAALDEFKLRESLVKVPKYDKLQAISIDNDPFVRQRQNS